MAALFAAITISASAQFATLGAERAGINWNYIVTPDYKIIYPEGMDSLAVRYGTLLQQYRVEVARSAGFLPNHFWDSPLPVVMHPRTGEANGAVIEAPRRMELYTMPDAYGLVAPMPWELNLAVHENRHVAQVQFTYNGFWGFLYNFFGEGPSIYVASLYANQALLEGDAVVAETALTNSGRGRTASFLSYYRMAFDQGDMRSWYRWRYGSLNKYTPDHYALGYMTVGGSRVAFDAPGYMPEYLRRITKPWGFNAVVNTTRHFSGKSFRNSWQDIMNTFKDEWEKDDAIRGPFQELEILTPEKRGYASYRGAVAVSNNHRIFAIRTAMNSDPQLVEISSHGMRYLRPFSSDSRLVYSEKTKCVYWTEVVPDARWEFEGTSRIRMMHIVNHRISDFTKEGRYVNPAVSADGSLIAAVEYPVEGGSRAVVFDAETGEILRSIKAPDGIQLTEPAFWGNSLILAGINENGCGIYRTDFKTLECIMAPTFAKIKDLQARNDGIYLCSDRNGTNEIYLFNPDARTLLRKTNTKYGAREPFFLGNEMYFTALQPTGQLLAKADDYSVAVNPAQVYSYPIADALSHQEDSLRVAMKDMLPASEPQISAPVKYSKAGNFLHVHSWLIPIYYNTDHFYASYSDYTFERVSPGAMVFFQNLTGTATGSIGLSIHPSVDAGKKIGAGVHGRLHYTGLYPVLDFALDVGDRSSQLLQHFIDVDRDSVFLQVIPGGDERIKQTKTYIGAQAKVSLPLNFSKGGWQTSLQPSLSFTTSTDLYYFPARRVFYSSSSETYIDTGESLKPGVASSMSAEARLSWSTRLAKAPSQVLPRLGVGADLSVNTNLMSTVWYAGMYGYLPGFFRPQGIKLGLAGQYSRMTPVTATTFWPTGAQEMAPRGFENTALSQAMNLYCPTQVKASLDYVIPAFSLELPITPYFYIRNLEFVPFADLSFMNFIQQGGHFPAEGKYLYSVGTDINVRFERFLFLKNTIRFGVRAAYNGGTGMDWVNDIGIDKPYHIGFVVNLDLD